MIDLVSAPSPSGYSLTPLRKAGYRQVETHKGKSSENIFLARNDVLSSRRTNSETAGGGSCHCSFPLFLGGGLRGWNLCSPAETTTRPAQSELCP
jgi:hypothetical protein